MKRLALILLLGCATAGCVATAGPSCAGGAQPALLDQLYFGTGRPQGPDVTPQEWSDFVRDEIAPRFPQGFSVLDAQGQWRNADGSVAHELSHVLQLVHPADAASARAVNEIAERYRRRFGQEAVLQVGTAACMKL
jgi:hypothetical protein